MPNATTQAKLSLNPDLARLQPYPVVKLRALYQGVEPNPALKPINLSIGEPKHPTPQFIRDALTASMDGLAIYPPTLGSVALRESIASWIAQRYGIPAPAAPLANGPEHQLEAPPPPPASGWELSPHALGLLLVPALAFDPHSGIRLGYGGGWYDRLRADPAWRAVPALVVLPSACLSANLAREPWDVPFQGWLDEHGVHGCAGRSAGKPEDGQPAPNCL